MIHPDAPTLLFVQHLQETYTASWPKKQATKVHIIDCHMIKHIYKMVQIVFFLSVYHVTIIINVSLFYCGYCYHLGTTCCIHLL
jgi:hypothetical protein